MCYCFLIVMSDTTGKASDKMRAHGVCAASADQYYIYQLFLIDMIGNFDLESP